MDDPGPDVGGVRRLPVAAVSAPSDGGRQGLTIVNYLSTHRLSWSEIERFDSRHGYFGILAVTKDGRVIRLNALQKSNVAS